MKEVLKNILADIKCTNESSDNNMSEDDSNEKISLILSKYGLIDDLDILENEFGEDYVLIREYEAGKY